MLLDWLFKKNKITKYGLREAEIEDLDFVLSEILKGAEKGHYSDSLLLPEQSQAFGQQLAKIIESNVMVRLSAYGIEEIPCKLWIYGSSTDDKVGYLLMSSKSHDSSDLELYKTGIKESHLGLGHGKRLVQLFISLTEPTQNLYARCYEKSEAMFNILINHGFKHVNTQSGGTRELVFLKT